MATTTETEVVSVDASTIETEEKEVNTLTEELLKYKLDYIFENINKICNTHTHQWGEIY